MHNTLPRFRNRVAAEGTVSEAVLVRKPTRHRRQLYGVLAQLVERLNGIEEVRGSNPLGSTTPPRLFWPVLMRVCGRFAGFFARRRHFLHCPELPTIRRFSPKVSRYRYADGRIVWKVEWRVSGKRERKFFAARNDAREHARQVASRLRKAACDVAGADTMEIALALAAWRSGGGKTPSPVPPPLSWREWAGRYQRRIECSERHRCAINSTCARVPWQTVPLLEIDAARIERWLVWA